MCILFTYTNANAVPGGYKLIVASNRDEFYSRPAMPANPWEENQFIIGGKCVLCVMSAFVYFSLFTILLLLIECCFYLFLLRS